VKPTIGATVHYVSHGSPDGTYPSTCRAALITEVDEYQDGGSKFLGHVGLMVANPTGAHFPRSVVQAEPTTPNLRSFADPNALELPPAGTWHWPDHG
jgi:hypothetical protein